MRKGDLSHARYSYGIFVGKGPCLWSENLWHVVSYPRLAANMSGLRAHTIVLTKLAIIEMCMSCKTSGHLTMSPQAQDT